MEQQCAPEQMLTTKLASQTHTSKLQGLFKTQPQGVETRIKWCKLNFNTHALITDQP